jgi:hypothetical protein
MLLHRPPHHPARALLGGIPGGHYAAALGPLLGGGLGLVVLILVILLLVGRV